MADIAIGIDLGTSNSCVALARGKKLEVLPNSYGEGVTPSVVAFRDDGSINVGQGAKAHLIHDPHNTIASAKRLIGRYFFSEEVKKAQAIYAYEIVEGPGHSVRIQVRDEQFSLPEVSAMVLREMKRVAEENLGHEVRRAVITVPAYFNDNQRQATKDAGRIAGLEVLRLLNEPTAAALAYGFGRGLTQRVAVYDLGGGTFDISILEIGKDVFEVLSTCGDTYLGGDDFDDRLIDLLADEFMSANGVNLRGDPYALEKLKHAAEGAKKSLSAEESAEIRIPDVIEHEGKNLSLERSLDRTEYAKLVMDLILRTFKVCDEALQQASLIARDLDGIILVGGPTRLPLIRESVRDYFQQEPKVDVDPDEVVAMGAAIHAASLVSDEAEDAFLLDVTPLSLRIGVAGGLAETVIERNTPVPIEQTRTFTTYQDHQESVKIRVYQGEDRRIEGNECLGQFEFSGFRKSRRGEARIDVTFEINGDGIVNVKACDQETGQQASTTITLSSGLSPDEITDIIDEDRPARVQGEGEEADALVAIAAADGIVAAGAPAATPITAADEPAAEAISIEDEPIVAAADPFVAEDEPAAEPVVAAEVLEAEDVPALEVDDELEIDAELELGAEPLELESQPLSAAPAFDPEAVALEAEPVLLGEAPDDVPPMLGEAPDDVPPMLGEAPDDVPPMLGETPDDEPLMVGEAPDDEPVVLGEPLGDDGFELGGPIDEDPLELGEERETLLVHDDVRNDADPNADTASDIGRPTLDDGVAFSADAEALLDDEIPLDEEALEEIEIEAGEAILPHDVDDDLFEDAGVDLSELQTGEPQE